MIQFWYNSCTRPSCFAAIGSLSTPLPNSSRHFQLSDVLVVVGPPSPSKKYDGQMEEVEQHKKDSMLAELENKHKSELSSLLGIRQSVTQDTWWGASLISTVLNNIQVGFLCSFFLFLV